MWDDAARSDRLRWFRRLALIGALLAATVVVLGAWVRLTNAGLGCPDWPGCYGHLYPQTAHEAGKAWHEMIHRYAATSLGIIIAVLLAWAVAARRERTVPLLPAALLFAVVCLQGALGALTVTLLLKPLIVTAHLFGGLTTLALLWWLSITPEPRQPAPADSALRRLAVAAFAVLACQIFLGGWTSTNYAAVACPDLPTCQTSWWPPMDFHDAFVLWRGLGIDYEGGVLANPARMAIQVTHRIGAVVTGVVLATLGLATALHATSRRASLAGVLLVAAVLLQICLGIATVYFGVPLPVATLHNAGAAVLVVTMIWLLRALWPREAAPVVPCTHVDHPR
jgi:cytochrome c oxidase assembly protein subunit 15